MSTLTATLVEVGEELTDRVADLAEGQAVTVVRLEQGRGMVRVTFEGGFTALARVAMRLVVLGHSVRREAPGVDRWVATRPR